MGGGAGVLRSGASLAATGERLVAAGANLAGLSGTGGGAWELANLVTVASAVVAAAWVRRETRGCHWREDHPGPDPAWLGHLCGALAPDGSFTLAWERA
jgi:L-aspartate oxidase